MVAALKLISANDLTGCGRRASKRSRVFLSATMMTANAAINVIIRDVSSSGAMITTPVSPAVGSYVTLRRDAVCVLAQVVWRDGKKVGLRFQEEIDEASILVDLRRPGTVAAH